MDKVIWNEEWNSGNQTIDSQHRKLVKIINDLIELQSSPNRIKESQILLDLINYIKYHFDDEERIMELADFPMLAQHKEEHKFFKLKVANLSRDIFKKKHNVSAEVLNFLKTWLIEHIIEEDKQFRKFIIN
jgi:hemerythrin-like metal-binding protein